MQQFEEILTEVQWIPFRIESSTVQSSPEETA